MPTQQEDATSEAATFRVQIGAPRQGVPVVSGAVHSRCLHPPLHLHGKSTTEHNKSWNRILAAHAEAQLRSYKLLSMDKTCKTKLQRRGSSVVTPPVVAPKPI